MANETTTKFKVDISELKKGIQDANRQIKLANAEFKAAAAGMDDWQHSADGLTAKISSTEKVLKAQRTILDDYKKQLALIVQQYGESSKEADEMRIKIANQEATVKNTEKSLSNYRQKLDEVETGEKQTTKATDDLDKSLAETKDETKKTSEGFTVFKGVLADLVASGIKAAVSALKDFAATAKEAFDAFDAGRDTLIAKTGATGEAAADLMDVYKNVSTSVVGDFDEMGAAVGELNTRFGISGKELEALSTKFLKFSKLNGTDVSSSVDDVQKAMSAFGLKSDKAGDVLDVLNKVAQQTGVKVSTLTKGLLQNGTAFQELGLSVEQSAALMGQMEKSGANSETVMNGLRKALKSATKDGTSLSDALAELEKSIVKGKDSTAGLQAAYDAFGKSGDQIYGALKNGTLSFKAVTLAADDYKGSVDDTYEATQDASDKIKLAFQGLKLSVGETVNDVLTKYHPDIEKAIDAVSNVARKAIAWLAKNVPPAIEKIKGVFEVVAPYVETAIDAIKKAFEALEPVVQSVFDAVAPYVQNAVDAIRKALEKLEPIIRDVFGWIVDHKTELIAALAGIGAAIIAWNIANVVSGVVALVSALKAMGAASAFAAAKQWLLNSALLANPIGLIVAAIAGLVAAFVVLWKKSEKFRNFWIGLWDKIKSAVKPVIEWVTTAFEKIWEKAKPVFEKIRDVATSAFEDISEVFLAAWGAIKAAWDLVAPYFKKIWDGIKAAFDAVAPVLRSYFEAAWEGIKLIWDVAVKYFYMIWENIKVVFSAVKKTFVAWFSAAWEGVKFVWDSAVGFFKTIWDNIKLIFSAVKAVLSGDFKGAWDAIKGIWDNTKSYFSGVWDGVKNVFAKVKSFFQTAFSEAWDAVKSVFSNVGEFFGGIWDTIKERFSTIGTKIGEAVGGAFKLAINAVIATVESGINFIPNAINKALDLINKLPNVSIPEMKTISLPRLANGGILKRGQLGLLEGSGAEAVVPLEKNRAWISEVASQMRKSLAAEGFGGIGAGRTGSGAVYTFNQYNNSPKALSRLEIYRQSKNLLSGVKAV